MFGNYTSINKCKCQMNAAADLGVDSYWIHRAKEEFESEEGHSSELSRKTWRFLSKMVQF